MRWQPGTHAPNCSVTQYDGHTEGAVVDGKHAARFRWGGVKVGRLLFELSRWNREPSATILHGYSLEIELCETSVLKHPHL